jgi:hypothetical protein
MRDFVIVFIHLLTTVARLASAGGFRSVVAESVLVTHQLLILNRSRQGTPHLRLSDRLVGGWCALFMRQCRLLRSAIVLKPSTLLSLHRALRSRRSRQLFSSERKGRPGPKGAPKELIEAVVQMKQRNPTWACPGGIAFLGGGNRVKEFFAGTLGTGLAPSRRGRWMPMYTPRDKKRTALLRKLKLVFRSYRSQPVKGLIEEINPILCGWVNYFAVGHSSRCFSYIRDWAEKKIRCHLARARQRQSFGSKRWSREWLYGPLRLFHEYRVVHQPPSWAAAPNR